MSRRPVLQLLEVERTTLEEMRDHHPKPYLRERAAALLRVAAGMVPAQVAARGLLKVRDPDSVYAWLDRYQRYGLCGLYVRPGRGRKPVFSPQGGGRSAPAD